MGNRKDVNSKQFNEFSGWDGFSSLMKAIRSIEPSLKEIGRDISVLDSGAARLRRLSLDLKNKVKDKKIENNLQSRLKQEIENGLSEGKRIQKSRISCLKNIINSNAFDLFDGIYSALNDEEIKAYAKRLNTWWKDECFVKDLETWQEETNKEFVEWQEKMRDKVSRRFQSSEMRRVFPELSDKLELDDLCKNNKNFFSRVISTTEKFAKAGGSREVVYRLGKCFAVKFKPWGAVKLATKIGKFAAVLGAIGVVIDLWDLYSSKIKRERREEARIKAREFVLETSKKVKDSILDNEKLNPLYNFSETKEELEQILNGTEQVITNNLNEIKGLKHRFNKYEKFIKLACEASYYDYPKEGILDDL